MDLYPLLSPSFSWLLILCFSIPCSGSVEVCEPPAGDSVDVQSECNCLPGSFESIIFIFILNQLFLLYRKMVPVFEIFIVLYFTVNFFSAVR